EEVVLPRGALATPRATSLSPDELGVEGRALEVRVAEERLGVLLAVGDRHHDPHDGALREGVEPPRRAGRAGRAGRMLAGAGEESGALLSLRARGEDQRGDGGERLRLEVLAPRDGAHDPLVAGVGRPARGLARREEVPDVAPDLARGGQLHLARDDE